MSSLIFLLILERSFIFIFQAEEEALMLQQFVSKGDFSQIEERIRPYIDQVLMVIGAIPYYSAVNSVRS